VRSILQAMEEGRKKVLLDLGYSVVSFELAIRDGVATYVAGPVMLDGVWEVTFRVYVDTCDSEKIEKKKDRQRDGT